MLDAPHTHLTPANVMLVHIPLHVAGPEANQQKGLCMLLVVALHHGESLSPEQAMTLGGLPPSYAKLHTLA